MRVLVVGAGRMGSIRVEDLARDSRVSEVVIANRNTAKGAALAEKYGARFVEWDSMTEQDADCFFVTVGTDAHDEVLEALLPLGLPVLCEKPISLSISGTQRLIELAEKFKAPLQIGFQRRFDPAIAAVRENIKDGKVGVLYSISMLAHDHMPSPKEFIAGSGGIFRDMLVHDFDLVSWLTGSPIKSVFATKAVRHHFDYAEFDDSDVCSVLATTENGVQVQISGTRHDPLGHDVRLEVFGSLDSVSAGLNVRTPIRDSEQSLNFSSNVYTGFVDRFRDAFRTETYSFISFANGELPNPCPAGAALDALRVAEACEISVSEKRPVEISELG